MRYSFRSLAVMELAQLLEDDDEIVRAAAAKELGMRGHPAQVALAALMDVARLDGEALARGAATFALVGLAKERVPGTVAAARKATSLGYYPLTARAAWALELLEAAELAAKD